MDPVQAPPDEFGPCECGKDWAETPSGKGGEIGGEGPAEEPTGPWAVD